MFRGVTDLNLNFLRNWGFHPTVSHHVFRPIGVRTTHGVLTPSENSGGHRKFREFREFSKFRGGRPLPYTYASI